jgi:hypothetical protein
MNGPASVTIQATILNVYSRRPNSDGSEWIAAKIGAGGFSTASGVASSPLRKGDLVEFTGRPSEYRGGRQIKFFNARRLDKSPLDRSHVFINFEDGSRGAFPLAPHAKGPCASIDFGYALTVHKFQGSQAKHIIAVIPANSDFLFGKPLLYTAISRAQISLTIIGDIEAIPRIAVRESDARDTALQLMFKGG